MNWLKSKGLLYFLRLGLMAVLTSFNFWLAVIRWGWSNTDPIVHTSAIIVAGATEVGLFAFLVLFHSEFYTRRRAGSLIGWGLASVGCVGVSLYVNIGYFAVNWHDQAGNTLADLLIRALFPMALLLFFSMIPPKAIQVRSAEEIDRVYNSKIHEEQRRQEFEAVSRQARESRHERHEQERAKQIQLRRLARRDILALYETTDEEDIIVVDWLGLEADLRGRGLYPEQQSGLAKLPTTEEMLAAVTDAEDDDAPLPESAALSTSGKRRTMFTAAEIRERWMTLGITYTEATIEKWLEPRYKHPYALQKSRKFPPSNPKSRKAFERRAPLASIIEVEQKILADRASKVTQLPTQERTLIEA